jgi:carbamoyltransferase
MTILGINYAFHDSSACLVSDGQLLCALEEERFTRAKHTTCFPSHSIERCLTIAGIQSSDIDHVAVSINPSLFMSEKLNYWATLPDKGKEFEEFEFDRLFGRHKELVEWLRNLRRYRNPNVNVHFVDHHLAHAAGSYFVSPWDHAALLAIDGWGEWGTTWLGRADQSTLTALGQSFFPNSLGAFYSAVTEYCGFAPNYDEGKTMGLAPTGDPNRFLTRVRQMIEVNDGTLRLDPEWFDFPRLSGRYFGEKFVTAFGNPRSKGDDIQVHHKDLAAAFQVVLEERALQLCQFLRKNVESKYLVLSGGVALNSVMNGRILKEGIYDDIYVMPAAGDNGTSIGAAYYVHNSILKNTYRYHHDDPFLGTSYSDHEIENLLIESKIQYERPVDLVDITTELLLGGGIVGWFQGKMEFGPRSLGNRSILADPSVEGMKDKLNLQVKKRESFRPFAPAVPLECLDNYFELKVPSPFMLKVCDVRSGFRSMFPAVVHVDGSARVQSVDQTINPLFHDLLVAFGRKSGHPVLLNTSFNVMGEPIVESPAQALKCFFTTGMDALIIGSFILRK